MFYLSKGGFQYPVPVWGLGQGLAAIGALAGLVVALLYRRWAQRKFEQTGHVRSMFWVPLAIVVAAALLGWVLGGAPTAWNVPHQGEGMVEDGAAVTPEFMAVLLGLTFYTSAFVAEVVRAGIQSVSHGQVEAASSLGLLRGQAMRLVILPQAMRVIIPPMTNQYLNLTKNSSLAVAIGYPDVVSIANTAINQTGRAVECIAIIMAVYLTTSLTTSAHHELVQQARGDQGALMSALFEPIPARVPPIPRSGPSSGCAANLFADWKSTLTTVILVGLALCLPASLVDWAIVQAVLQPNAEICQQARGTGACWGVVAEKYRLIIFGRYPYEEQWRPQLATILLVGLLMASCVRVFWKPWLAAAVGGRAGRFLRPDVRRSVRPAAS